MIARLENQLNWSSLPSLVQRTIERALALQRIPAPTFFERERALWVASALEDIGLRQIDLDDMDNVYGLLPGRIGGPAGIMLSAHTDTVFDLQTDLTPHFPDTSVIVAPGLGDNCMGVAALLSAADYLVQQGIVPPCNIWFVATSREEGLGNLDGMRAAFARLQPHINAVINLEGLALGQVYNGGIAVRRLRIEVSTAGGHSWLHFGQPSAIHALMQLGARITAISPSTQPRTTYNIGIIEGGRSVNSIADQALMLLDLRSEDSAAVAALEREVRGAALATQSAGVRINLSVVGDRPSGRIDDRHPLVQTALAALAQVDVRGILESGSTDGNIPLAAGCPAVTVGVTRGGHAHRNDEFVELDPIRDGLRQIILLLLAASELAASGSLNETKR